MQPYANQVNIVLLSVVNQGDPHESNVALLIHVHMSRVCEPLEASFVTISFHLSTNCVRSEVAGLSLDYSLLKEALEDAGDLQITHLVSDGEKTWHQRFRFAEAKCRGHRFPLSSVNVPLGPPNAPIEHGGGELATGGGFHPLITGVEDMEDSLGVCGPQTVFLFEVLPVRTPIWGERMFGLLRITYPKGPLPAYDGTVCGQITALELACFGALQGRQIPCNIPRSRGSVESITTGRELGWTYHEGMKDFPALGRRRAKSWCISGMLRTWRRHSHPRRPTGSNAYRTRIEWYVRRSRVTSRQGITNTLMAVVFSRVAGKISQERR